MATKTLADKKRENCPTKKKEYEDYFSRLPKFAFSTRAIWNMDSTLANYITQGLRAFKNYDKHGIPGGFADMDDMDTWNATLQKMIDAFDILKSGRAKGLCSDDENQTTEEGLDLFRKYFHHLWD